MTSSSSGVYDGIAVAIYGVLLLLAIAAYIYKLYQEKWVFSLNSQAFISLFMVIFLALRVLYFGSQALGYSEQWNLFYINRISSILYFTGFTFVLFRWIHSLERKFSRPSPLVARIVILVSIANVIVWLLEVVCIIKYSIDEGSGSPDSSSRNKNFYFTFSTLLIAFCNLFASMVFFVYGARLIYLIRTLKKRKFTSAYRNKIILVENKQEGGSFHFPSLHLQNDSREDEDEENDTQSLLGGIRIEGGDENAREKDLQRSLTRETVKVFVFTLVFTFCFGFRGVLWAFYGFDDFELESEIARIALYYIIPETIPSLFAIWLSRGRWHALPSANNDVTPHVIFPNPSEPHLFSSSFHISTSSSRSDSISSSTMESDFRTSLLTTTSTSPFTSASTNDSNSGSIGNYSFLKPSAATNILSTRNNSSNFAISFSPPKSTKTIEPQVLFSDDTPHN